MFIIWRLAVTTTSKSTGKLLANTKTTKSIKNIYWVIFLKMSKEKKYANILIRSFETLFKEYICRLQSIKSMVLKRLNILCFCSVYNAYCWKKFLCYLCFFVTCLYTLRMHTCITYNLHQHTISLSLRSFQSNQLYDSLLRQACIMKDTF